MSNENNSRGAKGLNISVDNKFQSKTNYPRAYISAKQNQVQVGKTYYNLDECTVTFSPYMFSIASSVQKNGTRYRDKEATAVVAEKIIYIAGNMRVENNASKTTMLDEVVLLKSQGVQGSTLTHQLCLWIGASTGFNASDLERDYMKTMLLYKGNEVPDKAGDESDLVEHESLIAYPFTFVNAEHITTGKHGQTYAVKALAPLWWKKGMSMVKVFQKPFPKFDTEEVTGFMQDNWETMIQNVIADINDAVEYVVSQGGQMEVEALIVDNCDRVFDAVAEGMMQPSNPTKFEDIPV